MRIRELSRRSGVPIPTIKYYLREGLLPPGEHTSPNQAWYEDVHLRRLKLVRALVDVGGLSIATARDVLAWMESPEASLLGTLGKAQYAMTSRRDHVEDESWERASQQVSDLIARRGWQVRPTNPARQTLAEVLATLDRLGQREYPGVLEDYAAAAERLAVAEVDAIARRPDLESMAEGVVVWTVVGDTLVAALRRLAQENESTRRFGDGSSHDDAGHLAGGGPVGSGQVAANDSVPSRVGRPPGTGTTGLAQT